MPLPVNRLRPRPARGDDIAFRIGFGVILALILCIWGAIGFAIYSAATDPEGVGRFAGRVVGGAIGGAKEALR